MNVAKRYLCYFTLEILENLPAHYLGPRHIITANWSPTNTRDKITLAEEENQSNKGKNSW